jgi:MFS superfamily sulfate permease-like transporter
LTDVARAATLKIILPYAVTIAAVGTIESLLTMQLLDGIMVESISND